MLYGNWFFHAGGDGKFTHESVSKANKILHIIRVNIILLAK